MMKLAILPLQLRAAEEKHYQLSQGTVDASIVDQAYKQLTDASERIEQLEAALVERTAALQVSVLAEVHERFNAHVWLLSATDV